MNSDITEAVTILRQGGLVAFPTETVYGLGADASNPAALRKIFTAKGRPMDHPLIVHLGNIEQLSAWARDISPQAMQLAHAFWPGPLTLILKKAPHILDLITGGQDTIGLRIPQHPIAQALLQAFGGGVAAPSANRFGRISPTTAEAVREELGESVDLVLEGGACAVGVESTIVDMSQDEPVILRPGMITQQQIVSVLGRIVHLRKLTGPRVSGMMESHYAPRTLSFLIASEKLASYLQNLSPQDLPVACMTRSAMVAREGVTWVKMPQEAKQYAHDLYQALRDLDKQSFNKIIIEAVPEGVEWEAIRDRLQKATRVE